MLAVKSLVHALLGQLFSALLVTAGGPKSHVDHTRKLIANSLPITQNSTEFEARDFALFPRGKRSF